MLWLIAKVHSFKIIWFCAWLTTSQALHIDKYRYMHLFTEVLYKLQLDCLAQEGEVWPMGWGSGELGRPAGPNFCRFSGSDLQGSPSNLYAMELPWSRTGLLWPPQPSVCGRWWWFWFLPPPGGQPGEGDHGGGAPHPPASGEKQLPSAGSPLIPMDLNVLWWPTRKRCISHSYQEQNDWGQRWAVLGDTVRKSKKERRLKCLVQDFYLGVYTKKVKISVEWTSESLPVHASVEVLMKSAAMLTGNITFPKVMLQL